MLDPNEFSGKALNEAVRELQKQVAVLTARSDYPLIQAHYETDWIPESQEAVPRSLRSVSIGRETWSYNRSTGMYMLTLENGETSFFTESSLPESGRHFFQTKVQFEDAKVSDGTRPVAPPPPPPGAASGGPDNEGEGDRGVEDRPEGLRPD